jgi:hypothetical protein
MPFGESESLRFTRSAGCLISMRQGGVESHLLFSLNLNDSAIVNNDFDGAIANTFDSLKKFCYDISTGVATFCIFIFHRALPVMSLNTIGMTYYV